VSVAFRREGDDEHKEPKFDIPIPPGPNLVTPRGLAQIESKVAGLEAAPGDETQQRELRYWRQRLATAQPGPAPARGEVGFGSTVTVRLDRVERTVQIVGEDEAEPATGRIGLRSPLAQALLGGAEGDLLSFAGRADAIEVLAVEP
jgi:transcription elongation GreA/GreB family factor